MRKKNIPFEFVFDHLVKSPISVKSMFGFFAVYTRGKIVLILCQRENKAALNGIWIAVDPSYVLEIKSEYPSLLDVSVLENSKINKSKWLIINEKAVDFEETAIKLCALIERNDKRIGHTSKAKMIAHIN